MKDKNEILQILKKIKPVLEKKYNITEIGLFGSYLRGEQTPESDIDILLDHNSGLTFFKLIDLENFLTELLNIKVDIAFKKYLKKNIGKRILSEVIYV
ncbi:MAG: nucleotidyltransferase family protein [Candidatus Gastranaerophilales bacterium]|nr:nucleotidyltransferase family protein [Candidatus Gastranaerophilales bacterium]